MIILPARCKGLVADRIHSVHSCEPPRIKRVREVSQARKGLPLPGSVGAKQPQSPLVNLYPYKKKKSQLHLKEGEKFALEWNTRGGFVTVDLPDVEKMGPCSLFTYTLCSSGTITRAFSGCLANLRISLLNSNLYC